MLIFLSIIFVCARSNRCMWKTILERRNEKYINRRCKTSNKLEAICVFASFRLCYNVYMVVLIALNTNFVVKHVTLFYFSHEYRKIFILHKNWTEWQIIIYVAMIEKLIILKLSSTLITLCRLVLKSFRIYGYLYCRHWLRNT